MTACVKWQVTNRKMTRWPILVCIAIASCASPRQTGSVYGAPILGCSDAELTSESAKLAVDALVGVLVAEGVVGPSDIQDSLSEVEIECVSGPRSYMGAPYIGLYKPRPWLNIEIVDAPDQCRGGATLIHEVLHWVQDRLLDVQLAHVMPYYSHDCRRDSSWVCEANAILAAAPECQQWIR